MQGLKCFEGRHFEMVASSSLGIFSIDYFNGYGNALNLIGWTRKNNLTWIFAVLMTTWPNNSKFLIFGCTFFQPRSLQSSCTALRQQHCITRWHTHETVTVAQMFIFKWGFPRPCPRGCLGWLSIKKNLRGVPSQFQKKKTFLHLCLPLH